MKILIALAILASFNAHASLDISNIGDISKADAKLIVGTKSVHFDSESHAYLNETNPSIGFEAWDIKAVYVSKNSWREKSLYLAYSPDFKVSEYISTSFDIGLASGYKCSNYVTTASGKKFHLSHGCNSAGIVPIYALTVDYSPFANNFSISASVNHRVAMLAFSYSL